MHPTRPGKDSDAPFHPFDAHQSQVCEIHLNLVILSLAFGILESIVQKRSSIDSQEFCRPGLLVDPGLMAATSSESRTCEGARSRSELEIGEASPTALQSLGPEPPYSIFTKPQRLWISIATSLAAMFSTMSSYIYFPALVPIAREIGVSISLINLTITSYLIVAGIAPSFMGDLADNSGRRPVYILMFSLMIGANVGIALQRSYPALLVLRMVQSAGSSGKLGLSRFIYRGFLTTVNSRTGLYGIAYGVIADIADVHERGSYVGVLLSM